MGILYEDDISKETLAKDSAYTIEITKFNVQGHLLKSKKLYVSMASLTKTFGDINFGWKTLGKGTDGKWGIVSDDSPL